MTLLQSSCYIFLPTVKLKLILEPVVVLQGEGCASCYYCVLSSCYGSENKVYWETWFLVCPVCSVVLLSMIYWVMLKKEKTPPQTGSFANIGSASTKYWCFIFPLHCLAVACPSLFQEFYWHWIFFITPSLLLLCLNYLMFLKILFLNEVSLIIFVPVIILQFIIFVPSCSLRSLTGFSVGLWL